MAELTGVLCAQVIEREEVAVGTALEDAIAACPHVVHHLSEPVILTLSNKATTVRLVPHGLAVPSLPDAPSQVRLARARLPYQREPAGMLVPVA